MVITGKDTLTSINEFTTSKGKEAYKLQIGSTRGFIWDKDYGLELLHLKGKEVVWYAEQNKGYISFKAVFKEETKNERKILI